MVSHTSLIFTENYKKIIKTAAIYNALGPTLGFEESLALHRAFPSLEPSLRKDPFRARLALLPTADDHHQYAKKPWRVFGT